MIKIFITECARRVLALPKHYYLFYKLFKAEIQMSDKLKEEKPKNGQSVSL